MKCACGKKLPQNLALLAQVGLCATLTLADTVKLLQRPAFEEVEVVGFRDGRLLFRGVSGQVLRKPLSEIEWFVRDRDPELSRAESLAQTGDWGAAATAFRTAADLATEPWLREWCELRWLSAIDRAGDFPAAMNAFINLLQTQPNAPSLNPPRNLPPQASPAGNTARTALAAAIPHAVNNIARERLRSALLELVIYDRVQPIPAALALPEDVLPDWDREMTPGGKPRRNRPRYGLLPERALHRDLPVLPQDSPILDHVEAALAQAEAAAASPTGVSGPPPADLVAIVPAIVAFASESDQPRSRLLRARLQILQGELATAQGELSRLIVEAPAPIACDALYHLARAQDLDGKPQIADRTRRERANRSDCATNPDAPGPAANR